MAKPKVYDPEITRCYRCQKIVKMWFVFKICDPCLEWETQHLHTKSRENNSWMGARW